MTPESVDQKLRELLCQQLKFSESAIRPEATFEELQLDSLASAELIILVEDTFGITVDQVEFAALRNYGEVVRHVAGLVNDRRESAAG